MDPGEIPALLRARVARGSRAPHADGARIALVVEGGAMRGVVSAGMVSALESLGMRDAFDAVYGSSAGALNAAYFLAGQARFGTEVYYEEINNRRFLDPWRRFTRRPILDLGYLMDQVLVFRKPLAVERVLASPTPFAIVATDALTGRAAVFRRFADGAALRAALRASATMPIVAGGPAPVDGRPCFDASLSEPIPLPTAEADGHTHALVLLTRPSEPPRRLRAFDRWFVLPRLRRFSPALAEQFAAAAGPYTALLAAIAEGRGPLGRTTVLGIRPGPPPIARLERRADRLRAGADRGFDAVRRALGAAGPIG